MKNDMIQVFKTTELFKANVIEALLKENDIAAFVMNKQDSAYGVLLPGTIEIYIPVEQESVAREIINNGLAEFN